MIDLVFLAVGMGGLIALCTVLITIGKAASDCPQIAGAARVGTIVVTTGFAAIGTGVIALIAAILPLMMQADFNGLYFALGIVAIVLGIGFYSAATTLRDVLKAAQPPHPVTEEPKPIAA